MAVKIKVLVVDDSAFMRKALSGMLERDPRLSVVGVARNGEEAIQKVAELKPDVVTMDVEMPGMNGLDALRQIMATSPLPVLMVSSLTEEGAKETLLALEFGAVDYLPKQLEGVATNITAVEQELIAKVLGAAKAKVVRRSSAATAAAAKTIIKPAIGGSLTASSVSATRGMKLVAIGCSTGGPLALQEILPLFPADFPAAVLIVQHMPVGFTRSLADRLDQAAALRVKEAEPGDALTVGQALLAPGGFHMTLDANDRIALNQNPTVHGVRPAIDVTLTSIVQRYRAATIGVVLTGMGRDGTNGALLVRGAGGRVIAEAESSCVVWGMPRSVVEAEAADLVVPLGDVGRAIERLLKD